MSTPRFEAPPIAAATATGAETTSASGHANTNKMSALVNQSLNGSPKNTGGTTATNTANPMAIGI